MACPKGGAHSYTTEEGRSVCTKCGHLAAFSIAPSYEKLMSQNNQLRKMLEDICECQGNRDELIDKARNLIQTL